MIVAMRHVRDRRRWLIWWTVGIVAFIGFTVAFYPVIKDQPSFDDVFKDAPDAVKALVGARGSITTPSGYLHSQFFSGPFPFLFVFYSVAVAARSLAGAEEDGTLELLLSNPVTRTRVAIERYAATVALTIGIGAATTVAMVALSAPFGLLDGVSILGLVGACVAMTCLALLHGTIAFAAGAAMGARARAIAIAGAVAVGGFFLFGLISANVATGTRFVTPWWWFASRNIVAAGLPPEAVLLPLGLSAVLATVGIWRFGGRDLR